jgi:dipeptide/tripeptide permease
MLSGAIIGVVSESYGWAYGFATAAAGMSMAFALYLILAPRWLRDIGSKAASQGAQSSPALLSSDAALRFSLIFAAAVLLCLYSIGWFQLFGSWSLFIEHSVNRAVGSFVVPVPWFSSINAAVVTAVAPLVAALWVRLAARGRSIDIVSKYVFALAMAALANLLMCISALSATPDVHAGLWAPLLSVTVLGIGEIVAWTATYGFVTRAAPPGLASMTMGAWYLLTLGLGGYLSGFTGRWIDTQGFARTFGGVAIAMAAAAVGALLLRRPMLRIGFRIGVAL